MASKTPAESSSCPFSRGRGSISMTGQENTWTEQEGQTLRVSVSLGCCGLWPHELFTRESAGGSVFVLIFNSPSAGQFSAENVSIINVSKIIFVFSAPSNKQRPHSSDPAWRSPERSWQGVRSVPGCSYCQVPMEPTLKQVLKVSPASCDSRDK